MLAHKQVLTAKGKLPNKSIVPRTYSRCSLKLPHKRSEMKEMSPDRHSTMDAPI